LVIFYRNILIIVICCFKILIFGQEIRNVAIYNENVLLKEYLSKDKTPTQIKNEILISHLKDGYFTAFIDSTRVFNSNMDVFLSKGEIIYSNEISITYPKDIDLKLRQNFETKNKYFNPISFKTKINNWVNLMNNNGFPFAEINFENTAIDQNNFQIKCLLKSGPLVKIDTLITPELSKKEWNLISKASNLKIGNPFNLSQINDISKNLKNTGYVKELKAAAYEFINDLAHIYIYAEPVSKNSLNGLIGVQPDNEGNIQFTGNVALNLLNSLKFGETVNINWRRMFNASQNLITEINLPYILNSEFGLIGGFDMIKKDTSFFNLKGGFELNYKVKNNFSAGILLTLNNSTNLLGIEYSSTSTNSFGFTFKFNQLDRINNPTKGLSVVSDLSYGWKESFNTDSINNNIYRTPNFSANLKLVSYTRLKKKATIKLGVTAATIQNEILFENEFARIGGYKTIRGFDEETIYTSSFLLSNIELRYLFDENSNIFLFSDFALTESKTALLTKEQLYNSIGFGSNIAMNNGVLTIIYGLGRKMEDKFLLRTGKIHLGFTSFF
jgi:hypothetical protein